MDGSCERKLGMRLNDEKVEGSHAVICVLIGAVTLALVSD